ncbi:DUF6480 family protein [Tersicoccus sp. MR15.9]|uniref:DUF6480 family protein n=1 Tax=Tersicoccus mangrovi TaxID=3121635 RepID=UPI002FE54325
MSSNPDPEDERVTGLEPGGGVPPGETPPAEGSIAEDIGHEEERGKAPRAFNALWIVAIAIVVVLVIIFFVGKAVGLFTMTGVALPLGAGVLRL